MTTDYKTMLEEDRRTTLVRPLLSDSAIQQIADTLSNLENRYGYPIRVKSGTEDDDLIAASVTNLNWPDEVRSIDDLILSVNPGSMNISATIPATINHGGRGVNSTVQDIPDDPEHVRSIMDICSTITHEYGHVLQMPNPQATEAIISKWGGLTLVDPDWVKDQISGYAVNDPFELGGEAFLEYVTDPDHTPPFVKRTAISIIRSARNNPQHLSS